MGAHCKGQQILKPQRTRHGGTRQTAVSAFQLKHRFVLTTRLGRFRRLLGELVGLTPFQPLQGTEQEKPHVKQAPEQAQSGCTSVLEDRLGSRCRNVPPSTTPTGGRESPASQGPDAHLVPTGFWGAKGCYLGKAMRTTCHSVSLAPQMYPEGVNKPMPCADKR